MIFGDVGGHTGLFAAELAALGADPDTGALPDDLAVVQVGDLVHRGPDADGVVAIAERFLDNHPDRYRQLVGNHEAHYLGGPRFRHGGPPLAPRTVAALREWWADGRLRVAAAVAATDGTDWLVTHAGLTAGAWRDLGRPAAAADAAAALARHAAADPARVVFRPGWMLGGQARNLGAGPLWAHPARELYPSWWDTVARGVVERAPFAQVHGHATSCRFGRPGTKVRYDPVLDPATAASARPDPDRRHLWLAVAGRPLVEIDVGLGRYGSVPPRPLVLEGTLVA